MECGECMSGGVWACGRGTPSLRKSLSQSRAARTFDDFLCSLDGFLCSLDGFLGLLDDFLAPLDGLTRGLDGLLRALDRLLRPLDGLLWCLDHPMRPASRRGPPYNDQTHAQNHRGRRENEKVAASLPRTKWPLPIRLPRCAFRGWEHPTSNVQTPLRRSSLDVGCWMLSVGCSPSQSARQSPCPPAPIPPKPPTRRAPPRAPHTPTPTSTPQ